MSYNPSTGIVQDLGANDGVGVYDVQRALGVSSGDVGTLCRHGNIRILNKNKPIRGKLGAFLNSADGPQVLTQEGFMKRDMGFVMPSFNDTDINAVIKGIAEGNYSWSTYSQADDGDKTIGNGWMYKSLRVNVDFARITDFDGYCNQIAMTYTSETLIASEDSKVVGKNTNVSPKFWTNMNPLHPRNFYSLSDSYGGQYCLGVAFYCPGALNNKVYFYVGNNVDYSSLLWAYAQESENSYLIVPNATFKTYLNLLPSAISTIYVVGFFAPKSYKGNTNIGNSSPTRMNGLHPIPGNGFCTIILQTSSGRNICKINFTCNGSIMGPTQTSFSFNITHVRNNYDDRQTTYVYYQYLVFSYIIYDENNNAVYDQSSRRINFNVSSGTLNITNTGTDQNIIHTETDINLTGSVTGISRQYINDGGYIRIFVYHPNGNYNYGDTVEYFQANELRIAIGDPQRV